MNPRTWMTATALAVAVTSVAPALVDGASAAPARHGLSVAVTLHASARHASHHGSGSRLGVGTGVTLHKVHGKVVHVHRHHHRKH